MNIHEGKGYAGSIILVYLFIYRITSSLGSAILGVCFWCFSKLTWTWSITAEVFGMNNLFTAVLLYLMTCFQDAEESQKTKVCKVFNVSLFEAWLVHYRCYTTSD